MTADNLSRYILDFNDEDFTLESEINKKMGVLKSTHEMQIYLDISEDNKIIFLGAWELGCGSSWSYAQEEIEEFENDHKGLLADIQEKLDNGHVSFRYYEPDENHYNRHIITDDIEVIRARKKKGGE